MDSQLWSWVLGAVGLAGFILAGRQVWWAWYINVFCQFIWFAYALVTNQPGFLLTAVVYFFVFSKNAHMWTKKHFTVEMPTGRDGRPMRGAGTVRRTREEPRVHREPYQRGKETDDGY